MLQSVSKDIMMGKGQDQDLETVFMMMASMDSCSNNMPYLFPPVSSCKGSSCAEEA